MAVANNLPFFYKFLSHNPPVENETDEKKLNKMAAV